ncbi:MAG: hypothetical protein BGN87_23270 [Rhizobiales bacterium 65-79]|nr:amidohydrolase [Hyphomicrobiales bacterium]OJU01375.1 MAG: hypothetical protein BGN87_23270 [Rhizobiales bacterium 65-79]
MITDIHRHFVPEEYFKFAYDEKAFGLRIKEEAGDKIDIDIFGRHFGLNRTFFDLGMQASRLDEDGIDEAILSLATPFINYRMAPELAVRAARLFNDSLAKEIAGRSPFGAWACLPMQDPEASALELRRCVTQMGFTGGHIASNVGGAYLNDERFEPVLRAALDLQVPLFVHPADPLGMERMGEYELTVVAGYLFDNTINILKLICSGFLDRWPDLKLVFAHGGAFSTILRARMQREVDTNASLSAALGRPVGEYLRQLYFDTICFEPDVLRYISGVMPADRLLLGSDAPFPLGEPAPVAFVRNALDRDEAETILNVNFGRLVGRR